MGDSANSLEATPKKSRFKTLKSEFKKIVWPDKDSVAKQTVAVVVISIVLSVIIAAVDFAYQFGIDWLLG